MKINKVMKKNHIAIITVLTLLLCSCSNPENENVDNNEASGSISQKIEPVFAKGKKVENDNFNGTVWVNFLVQADSTNKTSVGSVIFEPGVRSDWHIHPAGQILMVTGGVGYYQEKGSPKQILRKGDVVKCPPNVPHWHGASPDEKFIQVAITGRQNGPTEWLQPVTEEEYLQ